MAGRPCRRRPARRLTRSVQGEGAGIAFLPDGALLFESTRPDPDAKPDPEKKVNALWALPAEGGEARLLVAPEGGVCGIAVARDAHALVFGANVQRGSRDFAGDTERSKARKDAGVEALLFDDYPIRHWDHYLGPRLRRLYAATVPEGEERIGEPRDLDEAVTGFTFDESDADISPDGSFVVAVRRVFRASRRRTTTSSAYDARPGSPAAHPRRRRVRPPGDLARRPLGRGGTVHLRHAGPGGADDARPAGRLDRRAAAARRRHRPAPRVDRLGPGCLGDGDRARSYRSRFVVLTEGRCRVRRV